ncbi:hypothetical protein PSTG_09143 [Puccinia striiformis f. sp. tritici PST-78]|uniref:Uncharacterized protein n=1 Tax=Puccinia striiformis f. sp. tritici PST-78 TaxID=1165861 RepID=A0A0L0VF32_9BASI|nr:hypothetical protein PSTG_09143 [Puccinia striiformis f. sp. tritici PST-78]
MKLNNHFIHVSTLDSFHTQSDENRSKRIACEMSRDVNDVTNVFDHDQRSSSSSLKLSDRISTPLSGEYFRLYYFLIAIILASNKIGLQFQRLPHLSSTKSSSTS